ncbi:MAG: serine/threonine-protein phosphatase, partial [Myxococcales bacterium]|nr:serine/threonine-protein phosphatase [Myxococcales bacterium]
MSDAPTMLVSGVTHVGRVRPHNEDAHFVDGEAGIALVCDGMGGHAAGEVASNMAVQLVRDKWTGPEVEHARLMWLRTRTPQARRNLLAAVKAAVVATNQAIIDESVSAHDKHGMGTTFTGALFVAGEALFAHAGDSRAYLVRDGVASRLTEDHTLLARLEEAGVDVGRGEPTRWKGVVTNALGIGEPTRISTFTVPLADGDRFVLCSDGVTEYVDDVELGQVVVALASPARAAQRLVELAVERGGHDNATAVVVRVIEAGGEPVPPSVR